MTHVPFVPVVRDAFVAFGPGEAAGVASDGKEGFQDVLVEDTLLEVSRWKGKSRSGRQPQGILQICSP